MLDIVQRLWVFDTHDFSGVGSTSILRWLVVIIPTIILFRTNSRNVVQVFYIRSWPAEYCTTVSSDLVGCTQDTSVRSYARYKPHITAAHRRLLACHLSSTPLFSKGLWAMPRANVTTWMTWTTKTTEWRTSALRSVTPVVFVVTFLCFASFLQCRHVLLN
jgi:hypothetical protein